MQDAIVVGSGPNGLAAAIRLAQAGRHVLVLEGAATVGGGCRSAELTLPGFVHDVCAAIHPLAVASPFLRRLPLSGHGLDWIHSPAVVAHPFDDGTAAVLERGVNATAGLLGADAGAYRRLVGGLVERHEELLDDLLGPLRMPRHPRASVPFAAVGAVPAAALARLVFRGGRARALFAGLAAHSLLPLSRAPSAAFGLVLAVLGHAAGWPLARGGSQALTGALASHLRALGGELETGRSVASLGELTGTRTVLLDVSPRSLAALGGERLPASYRRRLERFRHAPGAFKLDWALDGPIPWRAPECATAATVHLGATLEEIALSERLPWQGRVAERPFVVLAQQSLFDSSRAPAGRQTAWAYCHVPNGSAFDMTTKIEAQVERFAPGFRDRILARSALGPRELEAYNPNYVGGDINGGASTLRQLYARPLSSRSPYSTPLEGVYLCSSSTPPGGGVHGMCGYHAAQAALGGFPAGEAEPGGG